MAAEISRGGSSSSLTPLFDLIRERTGLTFGGVRERTVATSLERAMARASVGDAAAYARLLVTDHAELDAIVAGSR
jgi:hypothetical protein